MASGDTLLILEAANAKLPATTAAQFTALAGGASSGDWLSVVGKLRAVDVPDDERASIERAIIAVAQDAAAVESEVQFGMRRPGDVALHPKAQQRVDRLRERLLAIGIEV